MKKIMAATTINQLRTGAWDCMSARTMRDAQYSVTSINVAKAQAPLARDGRPG
jgi:hypothetical protein